MVWGAIIGAVTSLYAANKSSKEAGKATDAASQANAASIALDKEALEFEKQRYNDWKSVFGDVQENLKTYYMNRSPAGITAQNLQAFEVEKARTLTKLRENFEARGLGTSGLAAAAENDVEMLSMAERAKIRADAPGIAAAEKLSFLTAGMGNDPSGSIMAAQSARAGAASNRAALLGQAAGTANAAKWDAYGGAVEGVIGAIEAIGNRD
jgi:gas vesicle protein